MITRGGIGSDGEKKVVQRIRENLNDYCCHVMQKVRRYTEYSMTWHLSRANMKFDENLVIFMQL